MSVSKPPAGPDSHWKSVSFRGHHYGYIAVPAVTTSLDRCIYKASDLEQIYAQRYPESIRMQLIAKARVIASTRDAVGATASYSKKIS